VAGRNCQNHWMIATQSQDAPMSRALEISASWPPSIAARSVSRDSSWTFQVTNGTWAARSPMTAVSLPATLIRFCRNVHPKAFSQNTGLDADACLSLRRHVALVFAASISFRRHAMFPARVFGICSPVIGHVANSPYCSGRGAAMSGGASVISTGR
jgi:hypothetical protein